MIKNKLVNLFFEIVRYLHFFLKGFVEDLLDLFWSESFFFSFGFSGENCFGDRIFWQNLFLFFFCRLCDIFGSFWKVLLKTFWMLFEVKIQLWIFWGKFFWWQNFLVRMFFFCRLCDIFGSFWRVLLKTFWMLFEVKIQFWIFLGKCFWWQNFLVRIFFL